MAATHNDLITIAITMEPAAAALASFTTLLFLSDEAGGTTLGGDRVRSYTTNTAAQADATLSAACKAALGKMFSQPKRPSSIKVGRVDTGGSEGYDGALAACIVADPDFFAICIDSRTAQDIEDVATAVEALDNKRVFIFQSAAADILTASHPAALADTEGLLWSVGIYHDQATVYAAEAWAAYALGSDPDTQSGTWLLSLSGIAALTTPLTETQLGHLRANLFNVALPYGSANQFVAKGVTQAGNPIDQLVTTAWFVSRVRSGLATARIAASARGDKITMDATGQAIAFAVVNEWLQRGAGLASPHFLPGQVRATLPTITSTDIANRQIRVEVEATYATDALGFDVSGNFSTTLIFTEE
jgi:hypothetical protein